MHPHASCDVAGAFKAIRDLVPGIWCLILREPLKPAMKNRLLILLLAAATFLSLLGRKDIVTSHEARVAQTARIMAASGWPGSVQSVSVPVMRMVEIDAIKQLLPEPGKGEMQVNPWLVPVINHQLRLQKPPLPYWCSAIVFRLAG